MKSTSTTLAPSHPAASTVTPSSTPTTPQPRQHITPLTSHEADATSTPDLWMPRRHQDQLMHIDINIQLDATHVNPSTSTSMSMPTRSSTCIDNTTSTTRVDNPTSTTHVNAAPLQQPRWQPHFIHPHRYPHFD